VRFSVLISLALAYAPTRASAQIVRADGAWASAAAGALALRPPSTPQRPAPVPAEEALRAALISRLKRNPVAAEFAAPILEEKDGVALVLRAEADDPSLKGAWATYKRNSRTLVLNRDAIDSDLSEPLKADGPTPRQLELLADRYLPVFVHELGGHARHYEQLARILGAPAPNARETETNALRLEAMAVAAERKANPSYLRDDKEYARMESALVDKYWESKEKRDPEIFSDYVSAVPAYAKIPAAAAAPAAVAGYYRDEESLLIQADRRLIGDVPPDDELGLGRRETFDGSRSMRR
jgi:hypothetical protein